MSVKGYPKRNINRDTTMQKLQKQSIGGYVGNIIWKREDQWYENVSDSGRTDNGVTLL